MELEKKLYVKQCRTCFRFVSDKTKKCPACNGSEFQNIRRAKFGKRKMELEDVCSECGEKKEGKYKGQIYKWIDGVRFFICNDCKEALFS